MGYGILSRVIEKVSGKNYEEFIQDSILIPAGCYDMHLAHNLDKDRYFNEVKYYEQSDADLIRSCDGRDTLVYRSNGETTSRLFMVPEAGGLPDGIITFPFLP